MKLGPPLPARLSDLADELDDDLLSRRLSVRVLGFRLGKLRVDGSGAAQRLAQSDSPGAPRFEQARITSLEAELREGRIDLGDVGSARLAHGSTVRVDAPAERSRSPRGSSWRIWTSITPASRSTAGAAPPL